MQLKINNNYFSSAKFLTSINIKIAAKIVTSTTKTFNQKSSCVYQKNIYFKWFQYFDFEFETMVNKP